MKPRTTRRPPLRLEALEERWVPVNPVNNIPGSQTVVEDNQLVFSAATGNQVSVGDPDGPGPFEVELNSFDGTASVASTAGLTVTGNGTAAVRLIGSLADVNAALANITFTPTPGFEGAAILQVESDDQDGAGGLTDTDNINVTVTPNQRPTNVLPGPQTTPPDTPLVFSAATGNQVSVGDPDGPGPFEVELNSVDGTASVTAAGSASVTGNGTAAVQIIGTLADVNATLGVITFTPTAGFTGSAILQVESDDLNGAGGRSDTDNINVTVADTTPPTVTIEKDAAQSDPATGSPVVFIATTSEPIQAGNFSAGDISLEGTTFPGLLTVNHKQLTDTTFRIAITFSATTVGEGEIVVSVPAGKFTDAAGNPNLASTHIDNTVFVDNLGPAVTINQAGAQADPTGEEPIAFDVVFSEPVTGFTAAGVDFTGSTAPGTLVAQVTGSGANYTVSVSGMAGTGTVVVNIPAGVAQDGLQNPNSASTSTDNEVAFTLDADLAVTITDGHSSVAAGDPLTYTITLTNNGPVTVHEVTLLAVLPPDLLPAGDIPALILDPQAGVYDPLTGAWTGLNLAAGQSATMSVSGVVSPTAAGSLTAVASVFPPAGVTDPALGNNVATDTTTVTAASPPPGGGGKVDLFAVGSGSGIEATVEVFKADGTPRFTLKPYPGFTGGVAVATGDVTGDGIDDIATGAGAGGAPHVKVFDGATGAEIRSFFAYDHALRSGVFVGLGDVTGDGRSDIVTGAGFTGAPHVKVFDGQTLGTVHSFFAFSHEFRGGVTVRAGDVDGDGLADVVTGAGPGAAPHIKVFSGRDLSLLQSFLAGDPTDTNGVFVGVANLSGDPRAELVAGLGGGVKVFGSPSNLLPYIEQDNFIAFDPSFRGSPSVAAVRQANGIIAILIGAAPSPATAAAPHVKIIDGTSNTVVQSFFAFDPSFAGGVFVG